MDSRLDRRHELGTPVFRILASSPFSFRTFCHRRHTSSYTSTSRRTSLLSPAWFCSLRASSLGYAGPRAHRVPPRSLPPICLCCSDTQSPTACLPFTPSRVILAPLSRRFPNYSWWAWQQKVTRTATITGSTISMGILFVLVRAQCVSTGRYLPNRDPNRSERTFVLQ